MRAAVVDVGSNSIKLLVASRGPGGRIIEAASRTLEVRIGTGLGSGRPRLSPEGFERGLAAISSLVSEAKAMKADRIAGVATSAVREASNGPEFRDRVKDATGVELQVLTGLEEAKLIGRGLTTDPALSGLRNFHLYDLGGGSLECLSFIERAAERAVSLPLGCVRLTEMFVASPSSPLLDADAQAIRRHVADVLSDSGFPLPVPKGTAVVGTGGTLTTVRTMVAAGRGISVRQTDTLIPISVLREILARIAPLSIEARRKVPGLPPERADIFPTAVVTLLALADLGRIKAFRHSFRNLRWGVAAVLLE